MACTPAAGRKLGEIARLTGVSRAESAEVEFREVPYFLVTRQAATWNPETKGDVNAMRVLDVTDQGIIVDPDSEPIPGDPNSARRHTFIPWTNVISLTVERPSSGAIASSQTSHGRDARATEAEPS